MMRGKRLIAYVSVCVVSLLIVPFIVQGQPIRSARSMIVVDAHGTIVGYTVVGEDTRRLFVTFTLPDGRFFSLQVDKTGFGSGELFFKSSGCTGTPYLFASGYLGTNSLINATEVALPGHTVYMADAN